MPQDTIFDDEEPDDGGLEADVAHLVTTHGYEAAKRELARWSPARRASSAPARPTDPETSHMAAKTEPDLRRFSDRSNQARLLRYFAQQPLTDQQATIRVVGMAAPPSVFEGCRRRCSDLRAVRYIVDSGRRRKNAGSDDESIVWCITMAGKKALVSLEESGWSI